MRKPIRDAKQIQQGDTVDHVHQLLDTLTAVYGADAALRRSGFGPLSFVFTDTGNTMPDLHTTKPPVLTGCTESFEQALIAGHLVYYKDNRFEVIFLGCT